VLIIKRVTPWIRVALLSLGVCLIGVVPNATAATPATSEGAIEEVIVTGSYIRGSPEDAALPVDVITRDTLQEQGSPDLVSLISQIPAMSGGNIGQSNRFLGVAAQGTATVNLRGLGIQRTLPLLNGQRMAQTTAAGDIAFVDVSQVPLAAIGQVEVLKTGASVTYGSDAIAGVVNFKTRRDLEGFEVSGAFEEIEDSNGDYGGSVAYGWNNDSGNVLFVADYARTSEIRLYDFDYMKPRPPGQGDGISGAANPGTYFTVINPVDADVDGFLESAAQGAAFLDLGCTQLGAALLSATSCTYPFVWQESPINDEKRYHLFGETNWDFSDTLRFHVESHYAYTLVPHNRVSVTLSSTQFPTPIEASGGSTGGGTSPFPARGGDLQSRFFVPANNPGLVALMTDGGCPFAAAICSDALANGLITSQTGWRPRALGGSPLFDGDTEMSKNKNTAWRISGGFEGDFANDWGWSTRLTYAQNTGRASIADLSVNRVQLGLRGLGGPGCNEATGTPGIGPCEWLNPFANSITSSIVNGLSYSQAVGRAQGPLNSKTLWEWMRQPQQVQVVTDLFTAEGIVTGDLFGLELPGGQIDWVVGTQWRWEERTVEPSDNANPFSTPCVDSPPYGDGFPVCASPGVGGLLFNGPTNPSRLDRDVPAIFAEIKLPILDSLEFGLAGRYENYGGEVGSTDDYSVYTRWEPLSWLVLRGSTGTTFKAPQLSYVDPGSSRIQAQFTNPTNGGQLYRPVDRQGNPLLTPETGESWNVGAVIETDDVELFGANVGRFDFSADYWGVTFSDGIEYEVAASVYNSLFRSSANPALWQCANDPLRVRFTFTDTLAVNTFDYNGADPGGLYPECHPDNFLGLETVVQNAREDTEARGLDLTAGWTHDDVFGGELRISADATYMEDWDRGNQYLAGTDIIYDPAYDRAGQAELLSAFFSYPDWRGNGHIDYRHGPHNLNLSSHYYAGVQDRNRGLTQRDSQVTYDVTYQLELPWFTETAATVVTLSVFNFTDEEPPYVRSQFNYDYATYNPLGRTIKLGLRMNF
jgi:iron complex outermembrane receptor protein